MNAILNMTAPKIAAPSIAASSVLIDLSISHWTGIKKDKGASAKVVADAGAQAGTANVTKHLLGECEELDAIKKFVANTRNTHYALTLPWSDLGHRLCPTQRYLTKYEPTMSALQYEFDRLVTQFLDAYQWKKADAQAKLGSLFNPDEYPTREKLEDKFRFRYVALPMPDAGDWRLDVSNEQAQVLREQYEKFYGDQLKGALGDVWRRTHDALSKMSERIDFADGETKKIFRDSLVDNVYEVIEMMEECNITGDASMTDAANRLRNALSGVTADALREDGYLRHKTKQEVDAVKKMIDDLPGFGF